MQILKLVPGQTAELKKKHPCGNALFRIVRIGGLCRIICLSCGRDMEIDRVKLEKAIKRLFPPESNSDGK